MDNIPIAWLLGGEPYIAYRTRVDLLGQPEDDPAVQAARAAMLADPRVQALVDELNGWPGTVIASHKSAGQPFHKLTFLADLGLCAGDPGMDGVIRRVLAHQEPDGPFQLPVAGMAPAGQETWGWALCDAPLTSYALVKFGLEREPVVVASIHRLAGLCRDNGWPCAVSKELGNFRGPGRKSDPCPFANLAMLKLLAALDDWRDSPEARTGAETLLALWTDSANQHPFQFFMGMDFRKLKAPFIWYDLLHMIDVLSRFAWLRADTRLQEMAFLLRSKAAPDGRFTPESIWTAWNGWEFAQKKEPSRWLTVLAWRTLLRMEMS